MAGKRAIGMGGMKLRRPRWLDALGVLALAACRDEGSPTELFVAAGDELQDAHCACDPDSTGCRVRALATPCELRALRKHQAGIGAWLDCMAREMHRQAECVQDSNCSKSAVEVCVRDPEEQCGPLPWPNVEFIQGEIELMCEGDHGDPGDVTLPVNDASIGTTLPPPTADAGSASSNPATNSCLEASRGLANVPSACLHCACAAAPSEASSCDATCWELIGCVGDNCANFEAGSSEQTSCAIEKCQAFLGGAMTATQLGPFIRERCPTSCMVPRSIP